MRVPRTLIIAACACLFAALVLGIYIAFDDRGSEEYEVRQALDEYLEQVDEYLEGELEEAE